MKSTLVIDKNRTPLAIVSARRAIQLILSGNAVSVDDSDRFQHGTNDFKVSIPFVVQLNHPAKGLRSNNGPRFSFRGVYVRDNFTCVYCLEPAATIDHVIPVSRGGRSTYDNCAAACVACNSEKADRTPEEMGWINPITAAREKLVPSWYLMALHKAPVLSPQRKSWSQHLYNWDGVSIDRALHERSVNAERLYAAGRR